MFKEQDRHKNFRQNLRFQKAVILVRKKLSHSNNMQ